MRQGKSRVMAETRRSKITLAVLLALLAIAGGAAWVFAAKPQPREPLGLVTSLPIYWGDGAEMSAIVSGASETTWVRAVIEQRYDLNPLDSLVPAVDLMDGKRAEVDPLKGLDRLLIVQPRGVSPQDNVALDQWVRGGGKLLLVLDPMLTGQYAVPIFDPRHPSASALIPAVMARWGLAMQFSESQPLGGAMIDTKAFGPVPVQMAGELVVSEESAGDSAARGECVIEPGGLVARCKLGSGTVTVVADAALYEQVGPDGEGDEALLSMLEYAFE